MAKMQKDKLAELLEKEAQIKAQIQALKQRESAEERKKDARKKILIGGAIIAKVKRGEWHQQQLIDLLESELKSDRDRDLFGLKKLKPDESVPSTGKADGGNHL
jgi:hypothetical protein